MNSVVGERYTVELLALFEQQGESLYSGQHSLCLTLPCLFYLQRKFSSLQEGSSDPIARQFPALQQLQENLARILSLKLISDKVVALPSTATLSVEPFKALQTLVLKKIPLQLVTGLQRLRCQLKTLVVQRCHVGVEMNTRLLDNIEEVVVKCCGDESTSFAWNSLKELDLSNNSISKLGDSLQYLPYLEKVNFSHNRIGPAPDPASSSSLTGSLNATEQSQSAADVTTISVTSVSAKGLSYTEGIECIDSVTFLHLGFNNLKCIPKFGTRAKYNLRILNLRNNQLDNIEGLRELDRLVELDLTDNMLIKHSSLEPFQNLHHLSAVTLQGNPLAYHPKHRVKTAKHLSNLINRTTFRLDGKKLSAAEKKAISSSLTHYAPVPPAWSPVSSSQPYSLAMPLPISSASQHQSPFENDQVVASSMPNPDHHRGNAGFAFASAPNTPKDRDSVLEQQQKWKIAKLVETGKEDAPVAIPADDGGGGAASGSKGRSKSRKRDEHTPVDNTLLVNSEELDNFKTLRKEMQEGWLKTNPNPVNALSSDSTTDDTSSSTTQSGKHQRSSLSRSSSQQPAQAGGGGDTSQGKQNLSRSSSVKKSKRRRHSHSKDDSSSRRGSRRSKKTSGGGGGAGEAKPLASEAVEEECGGEYGPRASSPVQPVMSGEEGGDCFLVERYESDIEEEGGASASSHTPKKVVKGEKQLMLVISERFLEEKSSMGDKFMDKWDLNTLQQASIEKKPWKSSSTQSSREADSQLHDVLSLQFNLERRDRSRREYVLLEEDVTESLLSLLEPIIQHNQESLSLLNRVECLACLHVFDVSQAFEQPSDEPQPLNSSSFAGRQRSLSKLLCPYCSSSILQYSMPGARSLRKTPSSYSSGQIPGMTSPEIGSPWKVVASEDNIQSGFSVGGSHQVDDSGRLGQPSTLLMEETQQSQDVKESSIEKNKGSSPLINGFNEDPESLEALGGDPFANSEPSSPLKDSTEEQKSRKQSETAGDDLSPWKKPKPVSLTVPPPPPSPPPPKAKISTNPFDGMEDDHLQKEPTGVSVGGAQVPVIPVPSATGGMGNGNGLTEIERRSHDQGPTGGAAAVTGGGGGRNPFEDDITGKNPFDNEFSYEYEEPKITAEVPEEPLVRSRSGAISDAFTRRSADLALSPMLESPVTEVSMSVPAQYHIHNYMSQASGGGSGGGRRDRGNRGKAAPRDLESLLYEQSRRSGGERHPSKSHNVTPPSVRKQYNYSPSSTRKQYRDPSSAYGSLKNSSGSTHSVDSLRNELSSGKGAKGSSLERGVKLRGSGGFDKVYDGGTKRYSSPSLPKYSPTSPRRTPSSSGSHHRASSGSGSEMRRRVYPASGSGGENSSGSGRGSRRNSGSLRGSSDGAAIKGSSPLALLKDDEPTYIHSNLNLYLDMDVFNMDKGEHFKMVFKSPVMQYGHKLEIPAVAVVSSYKFYIFKIIGPESTNAQQWLELIAVHHLKKLVYIDHGVGHQYLRVEFSSESACYTFLIRNDKKCTLCATMLAHIVTDVSKSSFRTVGVVPFTVDSIRYPERVLREVIMTRYDKIKSIRSGATPTSSPSLRLHRHINPDSRPASTTSLADDDEMVMYRLIQRIVSGDKSKKRNRVPLTLVLTEQAIYLGKENFAQWPLPKVQELPKRDDLKPPFSNVIRKNINDVEQIVLDRDQSTYVSLRFFKELNEVSMSGDDDSKWSLIMQSAACVKKVVDTIKSRWEAQFETTLPVLRK